MKLLLFFLLLLSALAGTFATTYLNPYVGFVILFICMGASLKVYDGATMNDRPRNLNAEDIKPFFMSKIFWAALLNLILVISQGLLNFSVDEATQEQILNLDWSLIPQALLSVVIILIRKTDVIKYLF
jgi:uncharacterized membrane protein